MEYFLSAEPATEQRIEIMTARFAAQYFNFNSADNSPKLETKDFLLFMDAFKPAPDVTGDRYSDLDREIFSALTR